MVCVLSCHIRYEGGSKSFRPDQLFKVTNKTALLFFNVVSLYLNTYWYEYINLTIDGAIYPLQHFPFGAAFVCQARNFWILPRISTSLDKVTTEFRKIVNKKDVLSDEMEVCRLFKGTCRLHYEGISSTLNDGGSRLHRNVRTYRTYVPQYTRPVSGIGMFVLTNMTISLVV
jgi:hypothetical protein